METREYSLLNKIDSPKDLKEVLMDDLPSVCDELRQYIIEQLATNPGHLGSSLGVVELTVALHYVFNTPYDRIVWDVGHQAYGHKILTGRREAFKTAQLFLQAQGYQIHERANMMRSGLDTHRPRYQRHWGCR